jgi:hypothetical protein
VLVHGRDAARGAATLVRERGVHGVGMREIVPTPADRAVRSSAGFLAVRHSW